MGGGEGGVEQQNENKQPESPRELCILTPAERAPSFLSALNVGLVSAPRSQ